jgi:hypothetical protein
LTKHTKIFKSDVGEIFDDSNPWKFGKDVSWWKCFWHGDDDGCIVALY